MCDRNAIKIGKLLLNGNSLSKKHDINISKKIAIEKTA